MSYSETLDRAPQRRRVLAFIQEEVAAGRPFPSCGQIKTFMGWKNEQSARDVLNVLAGQDRQLRRERVDGVTIFSLSWKPMEATKPS